jgi:hypothetical protein
VISLITLEFPYYEHNIFKQFEIWIFDINIMNKYPYEGASSYTSSFQTNNVNTSLPTNSPAVLVNSGLTDMEGAKNVARKILDTYDRDRNGHIDSIEVVPMIVDAYKSFNRVFSPSRADIESYLKVLDRNGDGRVTIQDLEDLCNKYLTGR